MTEPSSTRSPSLAGGAAGGGADREPRVGRLRRFRDRGRGRLRFRLGRRGRVLGLPRRRFGLGLGVRGRPLSVDRPVGLVRGQGEGRGRIDRSEDPLGHGRLGIDLLGLGFGLRLDRLRLDLGRRGFRDLLGGDFRRDHGLGGRQVRIGLGRGLGPQEEERGHGEGGDPDDDATIVGKPFFSFVSPTCAKISRCSKMSPDWVVAISGILTSAWAGSCLTGSCLMGSWRTGSVRTGSCLTGSGFGLSAGRAGFACAAGTTGGGRRLSLRRYRRCLRLRLHGTEEGRDIGTRVAGRQRVLRGRLGHGESELRDRRGSGLGLLEDGLFESGPFDDGFRGDRLLDDGILGDRRGRSGRRSASASAWGP